MSFKIEDDVSSEGDDRIHCSGDRGLGGSSSPLSSCSYRDLLKSQRDVYSGGKSISNKPFLVT